MWLFKVRAHYTTQTYWVRATKNGSVLSFSEAKKLLDKNYIIEDWKAAENIEVAMSFPQMTP